MAEVALVKHQFATSIRTAQALLAQDKLVEALRELSPWYDHPVLAPDEQSQLNDLLGQLAGSVIYSREHWLQPAHIVQPGETLISIAQQSAVPWQLLAKINGIQDPNNLTAGEEIKVVRGPFNAQLNRQQNWLALFVDGMYAGRFRVTGAAELQKPDGQYPVSKFAADDPTNYAHRPYISLGGDLHIMMDDALSQAAPGTAAVRLSQRDMDDVFDILSERSQVTIRR